MKGRVIAAERRHNEAMSQAWHTAALAPTAKKMPKLDSLLIKPPPANQARADILTAMRAWASKTRH